MTFDDVWQPVRGEDEQTALVFGFLRHAPTALAFEPWLSQVLGREVHAEALPPEAFWPQYDAHEEGRVYTEPDLVVDADDGRPLLVVVEVKPAYGGHTSAQLAREAVDAARGEQAERLVLLLVAADLGPPAALQEWAAEARELLDREGLAGVELEMRHSSWAQLGRVVQAAGERDPAWARYAEDVLERLRRHGVLGYDGAPATDGRATSVPAAVEVFNDAVRAARLLALAVRGQPRLRDAGLEPYGRRLALLRDGTSEALPGEEWLFDVSTLLVAFRKPGWPDRAGTFLAVYLAGDEGAELLAGAFAQTGRATDLPWAFAHADDEAETVERAELARLDRGVLDHAATTRDAEFVYAVRPWVPGKPDEDVRWVLDALDAASVAWDALSP